MAIRKFYLQGKSGQRLNLNAVNGIFFHSVQGLGFSLSPAYADLKTGFFRSIADDAEPQGSVAGTLTFYGSDPYRQWQEFANWCSNNTPLTLVYIPSGTQEFLRTVDIAYMSKGEKNSVGALDVPCSFSCLSPWFRPTPSQLSLENLQGNAIRYTYRYTETLVYGADSTATLSGTIAAGGQIPGALRLRYFGEILNPKVRLVGNESGTTYGLCAVNTAIQPGSVFELSTVPTDPHVQQIAADGKISDLEDYLSLSTEPYFRIPTNESCTLSVEADAVFDGSAELEIYYYFRSV